MNGSLMENISVVLMYGSVEISPADSDVLEYLYQCFSMGFCETRVSASGFEVFRRTAGSHLLNKRLES